MIDTIIKIILNTAFVSLPEEIFLLLFTFYISNELLINSFDVQFYRITKRMTKILLIPALIIGLISNITRYTSLQFDMNLATPITVICIFVTTIVINLNCNYNNDKISTIIIKTLKGTLCGVVIVGLLESLFVVPVIIGAETTITALNNNIIFNIICSFPSRILQYMLMFILLVKINKDINIIDYTLKKHKIITSIYMIINIIIMITLTYLINQLNMSTNNTIIIIIIGLCYPIVITFLTIWIFYKTIKGIVYN